MLHSLLERGCAVKILDCIQGSDEWWQARRGIPTASNFDRFTQTVSGKLSTAKGNKNALSQGALTYCDELIAESVGWAKDEFKGSPDIERGHELEAQARKFLAFEIGADIEEVGICLSDCGRYAASPDGLLERAIPVELKCPDYHTQVGYLRQGGGLPPKYKAQVHGQLVVTGAPYAYFCAYTVNPKLRNILVKVERDEYTENLAETVREFCDRLEAIKQTVLEP